MSTNYITEDLVKTIEDSQWEAEFGEDRERLLREEADNASVGEQGHDACFPNPDVWTVWINYVDNGKLVHFYDMNEAYDFAKTLLYNVEDEPEIIGSFKSLEIHRLLRNHNVFYVGITSELQTAIFSGTTPTTLVKILSKKRLEKVDPVTVMKRGQDPENGVADKNDWRSYLSNNAIEQLSKKKIEE